MINNIRLLRRHASWLNKLFKKSSAPEESKVFNKKEFLAELEEERVRYDKEFAERRATYEFLDKEQIREYNITLGKYDYQKIYLSNVGLFPKERFESVAEIYYFLRSANTQLTVDNILLCMRGLIHFGQQDVDVDAHDGNFDYFLDTLERGLILVNDVSALKQAALFGDLFCVQSEPFWNNLQNQLLKCLPDLDTESLMDILVCFSNQSEGGEDFYTHLESHLQKRLVELSPRQTGQAICCFYRVKYGTKEFVQKLFSAFFQDIEEVDKATLLQTLVCYQQVQEVELSHFLQAEKAIQTHHMDTLTFYEVCEVCMAFGKQNGSIPFIHHLQTRVIDALQSGQVQVNPETLMMVVQGLVYNLRATEELLAFLHPHILALSGELGVSDLARIIKSTHLLEYDDLSFNKGVESAILGALKDVGRLEIEEFLEVVKSYTVTRIGSRELYKTLDLWIQFRWEEVSEDRGALDTLGLYLGESGLASIKTLKMIQNMI